MIALPFNQPATSGVRTVWVVRHARTTGNDAGIIQGWGNYSLSPHGIFDAEQARDWWAQHPIDLVVSSPLRRATQTAESLFGRVDDIDASWVEQSTPGFEGLRAIDAHTRRPELCRPDGWALSDAPRDRDQEHLDTVTERALGALRRAAAQVPAGGHVAAVTHGAILVALLRAAGTDLARVSNLTALECEVNPTVGWAVLNVHSPTGHAR